MTSYARLSCAMAAAFLTVNTAGYASLPTPSAPIVRVLLERTDVPGTMLEHRLYRVTYAPGAAMALHDHPVVGLGYIVSGEADSAFDDEAVHRLHAGDSFADKAGIPHAIFRNASYNRALVFVISYTIAKNAPTLRELPVRP